eukprot:1154514-Pelagomonas_calceolata.AAC.1
MNQVWEGGRWSSAYSRVQRIRKGSSHVFVPVAFFPRGTRPGRAADGPAPAAVCSGSERARAWTKLHAGSAQDLGQSTEHSCFSGAQHHRVPGRNRSICFCLWLSS